MVAAKRSTGVAPEVNLRNPLNMGYEVCKQGIRNPGHTSSEVENRGISVPPKRTKTTPPPQFILDHDKTHTTGYGQTVAGEELPDIQIEGVFTYLTCAMILLVESLESTADWYQY